VQRRFCLINLEGIIYILGRQQIYEVLNGPGNKQIYYYRRSEGNIKIERFLEILPLPPKTKDVKAVLHDFLVSSSTLQYESVAFHPTPQGQNVLNFWRPHAVTPKAGRLGTNMSIKDGYAAARITAIRHLAS